MRYILFIFLFFSFNVVANNGYWMPVNKNDFKLRIEYPSDESVVIAACIQSMNDIFAADYDYKKFLGYESRYNKYYCDYEYSTFIGDDCPDTNLSPVYPSTSCEPPPKECPSGWEPDETNTKCIDVCKDGSIKEYPAYCPVICKDEFLGTVYMDAGLPSVEICTNHCIRINKQPEIQLCRPLTNKCNYDFYQTSKTCGLDTPTQDEWEDIFDESGNLKPDPSVTPPSTGGGSGTSDGSGDVNGDGTLDNTDALALLNRIAGNTGGTASGTDKQTQILGSKLDGILAGIDKLGSGGGGGGENPNPDGSKDKTFCELNPEHVSCVAPKKDDVYKDILDEKDIDKLKQDTDKIKDDLKRKMDDFKKLFGDPVIQQGGNIEKIEFSLNHAGQNIKVDNNAFNEVGALVEKLVIAICALIALFVICRK